MAPHGQKRSRGDDDSRRQQKRPKIRKQADYHSSSEEDENPENAAQPARPPTKSILKQRSRHVSERMTQEAVLEGEQGGEQFDEVERNTALNAIGSAESDAGSGSDNEEDAESTDSDKLSASDAGASSLASSSVVRAAKKRNDPDAFATSISKILGTKLSQPKREDPILSRSKDSSTTTQKLADSKLEHKARALLRAEKKQSLDKGRVKDVLALESATVDTGALLEEEKRLKKTAQRGVVRLFNAVRAAQVKAEEAIKQAKDEGVVGMQKREERVNEMSKQGFLDLISKGGIT